MTGSTGRSGVFSDEEREQLKGQNFLFDVASLQVASPLQTVESKARGASGGVRTIEGEAEAMRSAGRDALPAAPNALDIEQRAAVRAEDGPIVVVAGPGTGKTRVLTHRVAHLVRNRGVTPDAIVAVTFTNRAAGEMRRRLTDLLGGVERGGDVAVGTFHGLALGLLERYAPGPRLSVLDEFESRQILSDVLSREKCSIPIKEAGAAISFAKSTALHPAELDGEEIRAVYQSYQARLAVFGARDYDDILMDLVTLLETNADIRGALRRRCAHLLVDEFQDVNGVQYRLVKLMAGGGEGLFVIGDPDQAIYGFRGARPECFNALFTDFPSARRFALKKTYRSTRHIIDAARALVARGGDSDALLSVRGGGPRPRLLTVSGETAEGIAVVREISRMVGGADMLQSDDVASRNGGDNPGHRSFADFAVLFRIWQQAEPLERCFLEEGLPYRIVGQKDFLEAGSVREALTFFRYVFSPGETFRLLSAAGLAPFDPGPDVLSELRRRLSRGDSMEALRTVSDRVERLFQFVARYRLLAKEAGPAALLRRWQEDVDCEETPDYERFVRLAEGVGSLRGLLEGFLTGREADLERSGGHAAPGGRQLDDASRGQGARVSRCLYLRCGRGAHSARQQPGRSGGRAEALLCRVDSREGRGGADPCVDPASLREAVRAEVVSICSGDFPAISGWRSGKARPRRRKGGSSRCGQALRLRMNSETVALSVPVSGTDWLPTRPGSRRSSRRPCGESRGRARDARNPRRRSWAIL